MSDAERRQAARIAQQLPVRIQGIRQSYAVEILDVSRTGVRLRVPLAVLDVPEDAHLAAVARRLAQDLPEQIPVEFHPDLLGGLVVRRLTVVRVAMPTPVAVELGCLLDRPLSDDEAGAIGVPLPKEGESTEEAETRLPGVEPSTERPQPRDAGESEEPPPAGANGRSKRSVRARSSSYRAFVTPASGHSARPFSAVAEHVDVNGLILKVGDRSDLDVPADLVGVGPLVIAFHESYGPRVTLELVADRQPVWSGQVRVQEVTSVPGEPESLRIGFSFGRHLRSAELRALALT